MLLDRKKIGHYFAEAVKILVASVIVIYLVFTALHSSDKVADVPSPAPASNTCIRQSPYPLKPEFDRVLSLLLQRYQQANSPQYATFSIMRNCLDVQFADLGNQGAEGVFYFDQKLSNPQRLLIEVDSKYSSTDDLTTAFLLSHEMAHARQYVESTSSNKQWGCVDAEVDAFYSQLLFGAMLNKEESSSIVSRLERGSNNSQLKEYEHLLDVSYTAIGECRSGNSAQGKVDTVCYKDKLYKAMRAEIVSNPFYQEECKGDL